jgi:hypothetical protein
MKSGGFNADSDDDNDDMNSSSRLKSKAFEEAFDDITDSDDDEADGAVAEAVPADQVDVATRLGGTATSVHYAAQYNELETVQMLLDRGAGIVVLQIALQKLKCTIQAHKNVVFIKSFHKMVFT